MRCEIPDFKRCCCCCPLRYGILTFGYINLVTTILLMGLEGFLIGRGGSPFLNVLVASYGGLSNFARWLPEVLYVLEVAFLVMLLVGAHAKKILLIRIYYYYGILTTVATLTSFLVLELSHETEDYYYWTKFEYFLAFFEFVIQIYLLLLIRTELQKLKEQQKGQSYENHMAEVVLDPPPFGNERSYL